MTFIDVSGMASGKWIPELTAAVPVAEGARLALKVRLEVVAHYLPLAIHQAEKDTEHVHQLRVGTRRARAALDIFAVCLPKKNFKKTRKVLRRLRKAAGEARDWDVFLARLARWASDQPAKYAPAVDYLAGYALAQRVLGQKLLHDLEDEHPFEFEALLAKTLDELHHPEDNDCRQLIDLARPLLVNVLGDIESAMAGDIDDYTHLHKIRILGKKLRYAMELFAGCFPPAFRKKIYPQVETMQDILGDANDSYVASQRLTNLGEQIQAIHPRIWKRVKPGIEALAAFHVDNLPKQKELFLKWWKNWQSSSTEKAIHEMLDDATPVPPPA